MEQFHGLRLKVCVIRILGHEAFHKTLMAKSIVLKGKVLRFLLRLFGVVFSAFGLISLVIDGARSMAEGAFAFISLSDVVHSLLPSALEEMQTRLENSGLLWLWEFFGVYLVSWPASAIGLILGTCLLKLTQDKSASKLLKEMSDTL